MVNESFNSEVTESPEQASLGLLMDALETEREILDQKYDKLASTPKYEQSGGNVWEEVFLRYSLPEQIQDLQKICKLGPYGVENIDQFIALVNATKTAFNAPVKAPDLVEETPASAEEMANFINQLKAQLSKVKESNS